MEIGFVEKMNKAEASKRLFNEMVSVLGEEETKDVSAATLLKDLYDCNHCVRYIAQMYSKGIIPSSENDDCVFGLMDSVTEEQFTEWRERLYKKELRKKPEAVSFEEIKYVSKDEIKPDSKNVIINLGEKDFFLNGARKVKCSLREIQLNPLGVSEDKTVPIILNCDFGVKSQLAGSLLAKAGFKNITILINDKLINK